MLGFFVAIALSAAGYIIWEHERHVPVLIKEVPVVVQPQVEIEKRWDMT